MKIICTPLNWLSKEKPNVDFPNMLPEEAEFVGKLQYEGNPASTRSDAYYLSTNKAGTHWFLWNKWFDDSDDEMVYREEILCFCLRKEIDKKNAVFDLLKTYWEWENKNYGTSFSGAKITEAGLLVLNDFRDIAKSIEWV